MIKKILTQAYLFRHWNSSTLRQPCMAGRYGGSSSFITISDLGESSLINGIPFPSSSSSEPLSTGFVLAFVFSFSLSEPRPLPEGEWLRLLYPVSSSVFWPPESVSAARKVYMWNANFITRDKIMITNNGGSYSRT